MKPHIQEKKINVVQEASSLMKQYDLLPAKRPVRDVGCGIAFGITLVGVVVLAYFAVMNGPPPSIENDEETPYGGYTPTAMLSAVGAKAPDFGMLAVGQAMVGGGVSAALAALGFFALVRTFTKSMVYVSAVCSGSLMIGAGCASLASGSYLVGGSATFLGVVYIVAVFTIWKKYIPFTVEMLRVIVQVISENPKMYAVAWIGSTLSILWVCLALVALSGALYFAQTSQFVLFSYLFVSGWGTMICAMIPHTTYCGVFARWYYADSVAGRDGGLSSPLISNVDFVFPSLSVAMGSSFGSVCFGSGLVAFTRAVQALAREDSKNSDNAVACICMCIVSCVVACLGDILEYLNEWAYVQCALRGCGYFDAAKITYALCTCANVKFILADCLIGTVSTAGTLLVTAGGCIGGYLIGYMAGASELAAVGGVVGFITGAIAASGTVGIIRSGSKALLVCWAENPEPLAQKNKDIAQFFTNSVESRLPSS